MSLELQYEEVETLQAIFCENNEFCFESQADHELFILKALQTVSFLINVDNLQIRFQFPKEYPENEEVRLAYRITKSKFDSKYEKILESKIEARLAEEYIPGEQNTLMVIEIIKEVAEEVRLLEKVDAQNCAKPEVSDTGIAKISLILSAFPRT